ncbi:MAG TPA: DMT family transporter [Methylomusa anaerophila]|uniref:EamA-like transporter family protein n=1 Tax=Methylomusa anaerophila TaxID=1930071 RepID=A0A348ANC0_9FIRM|nr:DMT family transporter [Methylomusa anaerophila]BBB92568.1 EamA-like transporter family protein [Methylomusa anaerophila]HML87576.1 DMT family transporter [Methylomusa anaerophila]
MAEEQKKAAFFLVLTAILWSTGGVLIKLVDWHPMALAGARSIIAALIIGTAFRKQRLSFSKPQWAGAAAYCCCVSLFVISTKLTTAANAILLQYTAPIYVALLSGLLLGEKTTRRDWLTIFMVLSGMLFFFIDKLTTSGMVGNICAVASGIAFALFIIFMRMQKKDSPYGSVLLGNLLTFALSLFFWSGNSLQPSNLLGILLLGVFQLGLAYVLYSYAIRYTTALEATLITSVEPILNPVWVFIFLGEIPGFYSLIGGLIVLATITLRYSLNFNAVKETTLLNVGETK